MLRGVIIFVAVVGILQWLATMDILPIKRILKILFYNDDSMNIYFNENDYYHNSRVYSTFMEPSYLAGFAVGAFYYLLSLKEKWKSNTPLFIILLIEIVLSTSSTAYAAIVLVGVIFIVNARQISLTKKCTLVFGAVIAFAVLYLQYYELLEKVLFNKWNSNSGVARRIMDNDALNAFYSSKLLGVGYKCVRGSSVLYSMLGEIGIIGTVLYTTTNAALYIPIINNRLIRSKLPNNYTAVLFGLLSAFVCLIIAVPDIDMCTYWFWMYCLAICMGYKKTDPQS